MWAYLKFEVVQFFTNKKNIAVYVLLLCAALFYAIKVAPTYDPIEKVDADEIEARYLTRAAFLTEMEGRNLRFAHPAVRMAVEIFTYVNPIDERRLEALETGDLQSYAQATGEWYEVTNGFTHNSGNFFYNPRYYAYGSQYANDDGFYAYLEAAKRYKQFAESKEPLSIALFEQRTAWQTVERLLKGALPLVLILSALLLAVDIVTKDRLHPTVLRGFPIADWKKLSIKGFVALIGAVALVLPLAAGFFIIGWQSGFGSLSIPVPTYIADYKMQQQQGYFDVMTLGHFLASCALLLVLWFSVIIAIVLLCSVIVRNEVVNLGIGLLIIFAEYFYFSRGIGFMWPVEKLPTSYIQVGQVVTSLRNFYYNTEQMSVTLGVQLLSIVMLTTLALALMMTLNKRFKLLK